MDQDAPYGIQARAVRQNYGRHAATVPRKDAVAREVAARMLERFDYIRAEPSRILDLGCGHGPDRPALAARFPGATILGSDVALPLLQMQLPPAGGLLRRLVSRPRLSPLVAASADSLPFRRGAFDLVWSNLMLQWLADPAPAVAEMHRCLKVDGLLMFSTLGPDSLKELRAAWPDSSIHRFIDMHDIGDVLVRGGFSDPVMDMQVLTVTYPDTGSLLSDLREGGHANARSDRKRGLRGRRGWQEALDRLEAMRRDGVIPITLELVFGHAWKMAPRTDEHGRSIVKFSRRPPQ